ncbi:MAG: sensor histidine kinase [Gammaproteobacteria bacterium]|nr:sensor histidine kinase [Gammaproteobacteria bacterium]NND60142.1 sensor histidine kinase [Gammaproteobacteria bacterium]
MATEDVNFDSEEAITEITRRVDSITRENQALFRRLLDGERRFRRLAKAVWMVQEDERRRLARELHDGIGQTLTALKNQVARLHIKYEDADETLAAALKDSVELVSTALNDTRELSRLLRPSVLDDLGLEAALTWLARTLGQRTDMDISIDCDLDEERLEPEIETLVFRIVQESLTNVIKHAGVAEAVVQVQSSPDFLRASVTDKGAGFEMKSALGEDNNPASSGLRGMKDRVELFGGQLAIRSAPGSGTVVELAVPLTGHQD